VLARSSKSPLALGRFIRLVLQPLAAQATSPAPAVSTKRPWKANRARNPGLEDQELMERLAPVNLLVTRAIIRRFEIDASRVPGKIPQKTETNEPERKPILPHSETVNNRRRGERVKSS